MPIQFLSNYFKFKLSMFEISQSAKSARDNRLKVLCGTVAQENLPVLEVRLPEADPKAFR